MNPPQSDVNLVQGCLAIFPAAPFSFSQILLQDKKIWSDPTHVEKFIELKVVGYPIPST